MRLEFRVFCFWCFNNVDNVIAVGYYDNDSMAVFLYRLLFLRHLSNLIAN